MIGDLKVSGYSKCPHCGNVTFTTSYGACYLCGEHKDQDIATKYYDPSQARKRITRIRQQRKLMVIALGGMLITAIVTILLVLLFIRKG
jgi:uncharacterized membrane protein YvbJ